jgi:adenosine deaminase
LGRRIVFASILLIVAIVVVRVAVVAHDLAAVVTSAAFEGGREDRSQLRALLLRMPKGGDLHVLLPGAVYAERLIGWAAARNLCVDLTKISLLEELQCGRPGVVPVRDAYRDQGLYDRLIDSISLRGAPSVPASKTDYYETFTKLSHVVGPRKEMTTDQLRAYEHQNVQYAEFMTSFFCWGDRDKFIEAIAGEADDAGKLAALRASGLDDCVMAQRNELTAVIAKVKNELACDRQGFEPGCGVTFRYIAQVSRNSSPDDFFLQTAIAAALIRAEPQVVALNLVVAFIRARVADENIRPYFDAL